MTTWKVWAFRCFERHGYEESIQIIDFDVDSFEPTVLTEEEYKLFNDGLRNSPKSDQFTFLVHPPAKPGDDQRITVSNAVQTFLEQGKAIRAAEEKRRQAYEARNKKAREAQEKAQLERERKKYEKLKQKFERGPA